MKTGRSLSELAAELERQQSTKKDFVADTRKLSMAVDAGGSGEQPTVVLKGINGGLPLKPVAHQQLATTLSIPKPYYDRMMRDDPELLTWNVNRWLHNQPARKMIRTLDNGVRAILSDSYRPLDNADLAEAVLPRLLKLKAKVVSGEVTDNRFYLKAVTDRIQGEIKKGDVVQAGVVVSNSEVGLGSLRVEALDFRLVCLNGMIREIAVRKAHLGRGARGQDAVEDAREYFRDETRKADDTAFFLKVQDATAAMFDQVRFNKRILEYQEAGKRKIEDDIQEVMECTAKSFGLADTEKSSVLRHLIEGGDLSQWGLSNAVTRASQDVEDYDRATELESVGGTIVQLPPASWRKLACPSDD